METNKIYLESCLETMRRMPDEYLDCVVTSPPYYGLRSYDVPNSIWGGDANCIHDWFIKETKRPNASGGKKGQVKHDDNESAFVDYSDRKTVSSFCSKCNAWQGQLGLEPTFHLFLDHLIEIFAEVKRVLKKTGTLWVNLGDSYSGSGNGQGQKEVEKTGGKHKRVALAEKDAIVKTGKQSLLAKSLMNIPARFAIRMTDELGFIERNEIHWLKPGAMPSSAKDRFTVDFEKIFFFTKSKKYYFEQQLEPAKNAKKIISLGQKSFAKAQASGKGVEPTGNGLKDIYEVKEEKNMRSTWVVTFEPSTNKHYASYPTRLIEIPIKAGCPENGIVYDPFTGTATTQIVADRLGRKWIGSELSEEYYKIATERLNPQINQGKLF